MRRANNSDTAWVVIAVALIGAFATILAALIGRSNGIATGQQYAQSTVGATQAETIFSTQIVEVTREIQVTQIVEVTKEVLVTRVAEPQSATPITDSSTTITASPSEEDPLTSTTPPNTILEVGQTWHSTDYEITLETITPDDFGLDYIFFSFQLKSLKTQRVAIEYSLGSISLIDGSGNIIPYRGGNSPLCESQKILIEPKKPIQMVCGNENIHVGAVVDTTDTSIQELIVTLSPGLNIQDARWRIIIPH
jgi:hypothetical protein